MIPAIGGVVEKLNQETQGHFHCDQQSGAETGPIGIQVPGLSASLDCPVVVGSLKSSSSNKIAMYLPFPQGK